MLVNIILQLSFIVIRILVLNVIAMSSDQLLFHA